MFVSGDLFVDDRWPSTSPFPRREEGARAACCQTRVQATANGTFKKLLNRARPPRVGGLINRQSGKRCKNRPMAMRPLSRAWLLPAHGWKPKPKARWRFLARFSSKSLGCLNCPGLRLAALMRSVNKLPAAMCVPPIWVFFSGRRSQS